MNKDANGLSTTTPDTIPDSPILGLSGLQTDSTEKDRDTDMETDHEHINLPSYDEIQQLRTEKGEDPMIEVEQVKQKRLIYKVGDNPPLGSILFFTFQQGLLSVGGSLTVTLLVTEVVCGRNNADIKAQILSSTFLMIGLSTFAMSTFGVRLPIFQGPSSPYIIPLLALASMPEWRCPTTEELVNYYANSSMNITGMLDEKLPVPREIVVGKINTLAGSLMLAGGLHFLIGITGLAGFMLKFIGPITIVPAITLVGLSIYPVTVKFSETCWPVAFTTSACGMILSLYLSKRNTPVPAWNRQRGLHIKWLPIHQTFAILISVALGWTVSAILTSFDLLSAEPGNVQYYARTDTQIHVVHNTPWFSFPYPGQFGLPEFNAGVFVSFFLSTLLSVLDSIGDYSACARICHVPPPPAWAVNRGIAIEGVMSLLSGSLGVGHATVSYGGNIGAIGLTRVASRRVFQCVGLMYIIMSIFSKVGAVFVTVPYSVLGGTQMITFGILIGIVLSNLQYINLESTRNVAIIGITLFLGVILPFWVKKRPDGIQTGSEDVDRLLRILLSNPVFVGGFLSCFLDNTIPGTRKERGLWDATEDTKDVSKEKEKGDKMKTVDVKDEEDLEFEEGLEVYDIPYLPDRLQRSSLAKFIRIFPGKPKDVKNEAFIDPQIL